MTNVSLPNSAEPTATSTSKNVSPAVSFDLSPDSIDSSIALDGVYRWGLVFHCNARVSDDGECVRCHRRVPLNQPEFKCPDCDYASTVRTNVEFHFLDQHTNMCPVCRTEPGLLPDQQVAMGARGCKCPKG